MVVRSSLKVRRDKSHGVVNIIKDVVIAIQRTKKVTAAFYADNLGFSDIFTVVLYLL